MASNAHAVRPPFPFDAAYSLGAAVINDLVLYCTCTTHHPLGEESALFRRVQVRVRVRVRVWGGGRLLCIYLGF